MQSAGLEGSPVSGAKALAFLASLLALSWPFVRYLLDPRVGSRLTSVRNDLQTIAIEWTISIVLALVIFGAQRQQPAFVGLRNMHWPDWVLVIPVFVFTLIASGLVSRVVRAPTFDLHGMAAVPFAVRLSLVLTAAICEEFMFRGVAIEELGVLAGSRWFSAIISVTLFGLGHLGVYGFSSALLIPTTVGLVLTLLYMLRNNLVLFVIVHALMDGLFLLLVPLFIHG
ncbi:MAG: CPBP family intramembrane metalloprotease [Acidobacteria bacterium]|nr:CPBP family intramembrane metalloprotease [Acidobacteriota bacterium]